MTDEGESSDAPASGPEAVKASLKDRKRVGKLEVIDGGKNAKPKQRRRGTGSYDVDAMNREYALVLMGSKAVVVRRRPTCWIASPRA